MASEGLHVLFVVMPFAEAEHPAIGVSLLKSEVEGRGFTARVAHFTLDLAQAMGPELYRAVTSDMPTEHLVGEWLFADLAFPDATLPPADRYVRRILRQSSEGRRLAGPIVEARALCSPFLDRCLDEVVRLAPRVVGFTTSFHQTVPGLALARRLKALSEPPVVVFGGANCEGEMGRELLRSFPWIDAVCTQEGDRAFPDLLERMRVEDRIEPVPGIVRRGVAEPAEPPEPILDLDALPVPDYADYYRDAERLGLARTMIHLPVETARGCWWGAAHHCTFCGLNGMTMAYRSKSPDRAYREIVELVERYGVEWIHAVDNILDMRYFESLFPRLRDEGPPVQLSWELKANLRYDQVRTLREAGVRVIQPGIESLNDEILRLMRKGCTALQNIRLLRWCEELGIAAMWNLLWGFPGEPPEAYDRMAALIPMLTHLAPPMLGQIRLDRFSPYYMEAESFGITNVRPAAAYGYVFPVSAESQSRLAYFFDYDHADQRRPETYTAGTRRAVERWRRLQEAGQGRVPRLDAFDGEDGFVVVDTRPGAIRGVHLLDGLLADVYRVCDEPRSVRGILDRIEEADEDEVRSALAALTADGLLIEEGGRHLSLAVFRTRRRAPEAPGAQGPAAERADERGGAETGSGPRVMVEIGGRGERARGGTA